MIQMTLCIGEVKLKKNIKISKLLKSLDVVNRFKGVNVINGEIGINAKYFDDYLVLAEFLDLIKQKKIKLTIEELGEEKDFKYIRKLLE